MNKRDRHPLQGVGGQIQTAEELAAVARAIEPERRR